MSWFAKETILVPFDFSEDSLRTVDEALTMVADATHIHILHVLPVLAATEPGVVWESVSDESRRESVEQELRARFKDDRYAGLRFAVGFGDPGTVIADHAKRINAELVALPSHGRTGLKRMLLGSVAERVCRLAHCPVLVFRE